MSTERRTVIIPLMGGLGNQLFQFAAGLYLRKKLGVFINFPTTLLHPPKFLRATNTTDRNLMIGELVHSDESQNVSRLKLLVLRILTNSRAKFVVLESDQSFESLDKVSPESRFFIGYFQNLKYVNTVRNDLLARFSASTTFRGLIPTALEPRIAIHMRLGDYSSNQQARSYHGLTDISYFVDGAKILLDKLNCRSILIVSDEPDRARALFEENFKRDDVEITNNTSSNEYEDLRLLSHSAGLVTSNSSFSWWAAWLSSSLGSHVIVPSPWLAELSRAEENLFDSRWTILERRISVTNQWF